MRGFELKSFPFLAFLFAVSTFSKNVLNIIIAIANKELIFFFALVPIYNNDWLKVTFVTDDDWIPTSVYSVQDPTFIDGRLRHCFKSLAL